MEPRSSGWHSPHQAWARTQGQLAWYNAMEEAGEMIMIGRRKDLEDHIALCNDGKPNDTKPVGYILSLERAHSIITIDHLQAARNYGLRAIGPTHYGPGRYANGTDATGNLNEQGRALEMERPGNHRRFSMGMRMAIFA